MQPISVLGYYDKGNIGDEAYKLAFPKLFPNYKFDFRDQIIGNPETIILGGGDVLSREFTELLRGYPKAKKYALSVNFREENATLIRKFDKIIARNRNNQGIEVRPDFTFALSGNKNNGEKLIKELCTRDDVDLYENTVIITLNSFLCSRENILARDYVNFDKICFELATLMDETSATFILLPLGNGFPQNDRISNSCIYTTAKFYKKNLLIYDKLTVQETLDIFAAADAAITSRLHAAIFSCIGHVPFIDLTHHTKNQLFLESIGKSDWSFNYWHFDYQRAKSLLHSFLENDKFSEEMTKIDDKAKSLLAQINLDFCAFQS